MIPVHSNMHACSCCKNRPHLDDGRVGQVSQLVDRHRDENRNRTNHRLQAQDGVLLSTMEVITLEFRIIL